MTDLDLRHIHLSSNNIASFARKADAISFAKAHGWPASSVLSAANRFNRFWVIGQGIATDGDYTILTQTGTPTLFPHITRF